MPSLLALIKKSRLLVSFSVSFSTASNHLFKIRASSLLHIEDLYLSAIAAID